MNLYQLYGCQRDVAVKQCELFQLLLVVVEAMVWPTYLQPKMMMQSFCKTLNKNRTLSAQIIIVNQRISSVLNSGYWFNQNTIIRGLIRE